MNLPPVGLLFYFRKFTQNDICKKFSEDEYNTLKGYEPMFHWASYTKYCERHEKRLKADIHYLNSGGNVIIQTPFERSDIKGTIRRIEEAENSLNFVSWVERSLPIITFFKKSSCIG
jgi:predicted TIM-barrel fold metal-dependent hydrolase